jgi:hypothetical protein
MQPPGGDDGKIQNSKHEISNKFEAPKGNANDRNGNNGRQLEGRRKNPKSEARDSGFRLRVVGQQIAVFPV